MTEPRAPLYLFDLDKIKANYPFGWKKVDADTIRATMPVAIHGYVPDTVEVEVTRYHGGSFAAGYRYPPSTRWKEFGSDRSLDNLLALITNEAAGYVCQRWAVVVYKTAALVHDRLGGTMGVDGYDAEMITEINGLTVVVERTHGESNSPVTLLGESDFDVKGGQPPNGFPIMEGKEEDAVNALIECWTDGYADYFGRIKKGLDRLRQSENDHDRV